MKNLLEIAMLERSKIILLTYELKLFSYETLVS